MSSPAPPSPMPATFQPIPLPLKLRRWRRGEPARGGQARLHASDANGRKLGFVDQVTGLLYPRDEAHRGPLVELLRNMGVAVRSPEPHELDALTFPEGAVTYPSPRHLKVYWDPGERMARMLGPRDNDPDEFLPPRLFALYDQERHTLAVAEDDAWDLMVSLLRRGGHLQAGEPRRPIDAEGADAHLRHCVDTEERMRSMVTLPFPGADASERTSAAGGPPAWRPAAPPTEPLAAEPPKQPATGPATLTRPATPARVNCAASDAAVSSLPPPARAHFLAAFARLHGDHRDQPEHDAWTQRDDYDRRAHDPRQLRLRPPEGLVAGYVDHVDRLIEDYGAHFCLVAAFHAVRRAPALWGWALAEWERRDRPSFSPFLYENPGQPGGALALLAGALFHHARDRRGWSRLRPRPCGLCAEVFLPSRLTWKQLRLQGGPPRYCPTCVRGLGGTHLWPGCWEAMHELLRHLADRSLQLPQQARSSIPIPAGRTDQERDILVAARIALPTLDVLRSQPEYADWTALLAAAGLLATGARHGRGIWSVARDGHLCRSAFECSIDDHFSVHNLAHECEPVYPYHRAYNPSGRKRADWLLEDGRYVEAAGMLTDPAYAARLDQKRQLCAALGLELVVITSQDVLDLAFILHPNRPQGTR